MGALARGRLLAGGIALVAVLGAAATPAPTTPATASTTTPTPATAGSATATSPTRPSTSAQPPDAVQLQFVADVDRPVDLKWRTGDDTLYVVLQGGQVVPIRNGVALPAVADIHDRISSGNEQGLLGLAFSPDGTHAFLDFTDTEGNTQVEAYAVAADGTFDTAHPIHVFSADQPYPNHNGGDLAIGPDGMLYITLGDGGSAGDPDRRALDLGDPLGKIIRLDVGNLDAVAAAGRAPAPADNPFAATGGVAAEVWSFGLRNPWRIAFDRPTGDLWIADVGQGDWEEVDVARANPSTGLGAGRGLNFGWSAYEGTHRFNDDQPTDGVTMPVHEYSHDHGCSISGGAVYRGSAIPALRGWYLFSDDCNGEIRAVPADRDTIGEAIVLAASETVVAVREGPDGELYVLSFAKGVLRIAA